MWLPGADLSRTTFRGSSLRHANLDNTDLTGADFVDVDLSGVRLEETVPVTAVAASSDERLYAAYGDRTIRRWTATAHSARDDTVVRLPFVADRLWFMGNRVIVASGEGRIAVVVADDDRR